VTNPATRIARAVGRGRFARSLMRAVVWTYLLQAFLACNASFKILLAMAYLTNDHPAVLREAFPLYDPARHKASSGSL
jgi:hypothetical protein